MTSIVRQEMRRISHARACAVTIGDTPILERLQAHLVRGLLDAPETESLVMACRSDHITIDHITIKTTQEKVPTVARNLQKLAPPSQLVQPQLGVLCTGDLPAGH